MAPGSDRGVVGESFSLSPSQAESYATCPRLYVFDRRLAISTPASPYGTFGSIIHGVLERAERTAMSEGRRSDLTDALAALDSRIEDGTFGPDAATNAWRRRGEQLLSRLYGEWPSDSSETVAVERDLVLDIDGITWRGRADRIETTASGRIRVVDFKTGSTLPRGVDAAGSLQLGFYLLAAAADEEISAAGEPAEAELWYPLTSSRTWRLPFDSKRLSDVRNQLADIGRRIADERWEPRVGKHCARCPMKLACDRWPDGREAFVE
jgi:RecB family exonuclease